MHMHDIIMEFIEFLIRVVLHVSLKLFVAAILFHFVVAVAVVVSIFK